MTTKTQKQDKNKLAEIDENISKLFDIKKRLGKGAYGIVWKAMDKRTNETLAVKKIFDAFRDETDAQRTFREIIFLKAFRSHPNVIKLHNVFKASNNLDIYLIFEYMESDLHNIIKKGSILKDIHKRYVMYQLINAIKYIHSGNVIHRDLKPSNVLIDSKCRCKLADFGLARSVSNRPLREGCQDINEPIMEPLLTDYVATRWYRAPEILVASKRYTKGIDMWSLGCILGEMIRGKPIFQGTSTVNQIEKIVTALPEITEHDINAVGAGFGSVLLSKQISRERKTSLEELLPDAPDDALHLVMSLLVLDPLGRLNAKQALAHPYVEKFRNSITELELSVDILPPFRDDVRLSVPEYRSKLYEIVQLNAEKSHARQNLSSSALSKGNNIHNTHSSGNTSNNNNKTRQQRTQQTHNEPIKSRSSSKVKQHNETPEKSLPTRAVAANERHDVNEIVHKTETSTSIASNKTTRVRSSPLQKRRTSQTNYLHANSVPYANNTNSTSTLSKLITSGETMQKQALQQDERPQIVIPRSKVVLNRNNALDENIYATTANQNCAEYKKRHSIDCGYVSLPDGIIKQLSPDSASLRKQQGNGRLHKSSSSLHHNDTTKTTNHQTDDFERLHFSTTAAAAAAGHDVGRYVGSSIVRGTKSDLITHTNNRSLNALSSSSSSCASKPNDRICYEQRLKKLEEEIEKYKKEVKNFCKETYRYSKQQHQQQHQQQKSLPSSRHQTLPHPRTQYNKHSQLTRTGKHAQPETPRAQQRATNALAMPLNGGSTPKTSSYFKLPVQRSQRDYELSYLNGAGGGGGGSGDHIGRNNKEYIGNVNYQQQSQLNHQRVKPISKFI